jgi:hypothetical protein
MRLVGSGDGRLAIPVGPPALEEPTETAPEESPSLSPETKRKKKKSKKDKTPSPEPDAAAEQAAPEDPNAHLDLVSSAVLSSEQQYMALACNSGLVVYDLDPAGWLDHFDEPEPEPEPVAAEGEPTAGEGEEGCGGSGGGDGAVENTPSSPAPPCDPPKPPTLMFELAAPENPLIPALVQAGVFDAVGAMCLAPAFVSPAPTVGDEEAAPFSAPPVVRVQPNFHTVSNVGTVLSVVWPGRNEWRYMPIVRGAQTGNVPVAKRVWTLSAISACCSNGAELLAVGMVDGGVSVWDLAKNESRCTFQNSGAAVSMIHFAPSGVIVVGGADGSSTLIDLNNTEAKQGIDLARLDELSEGTSTPHESAAVTGIVATDTFVVLAQESGRTVAVDATSGEFLALFSLPTPWQIVAGSLTLDGPWLFVIGKLYADENATMVFRFDTSDISTMASPRPEKQNLPLNAAPWNLGKVGNDYAADLATKRAAREARMQTALSKLS